jgi:uncharacterized protein (DUF1800 family)
MADHEIALMAHLLRRAGFGSSRDEVEAKVAQGYDNVVDELLNVGEDPGIDEDLMYRAYPSYFDKAAIETGQTEWVYRMINNRHQLQEKMSLFWHTIFCSGDNKVDNARTTVIQIDKFREQGMGNFQDLIMMLSQDPAMLYYLDNIESHKTAVNENYGRELLELFSMGVGKDGEINYTEDDVKACARAFTGWNLAPTIPVFPYGRTPFEFRFDPADHDFGEKTFLGETGPWNGEDIVEIICKQPATARFIARKMYDFFVADEPPVPSWRQSDPRDPEAIKTLEKAYFDSGYDIKAMLRALFTSDFFKSEPVRYAKVKSPAEVVIGTLRMVGQHTGPQPGLFFVAMEPKYMGMDLLNPPTVEGWHTGAEWINSGTLIDRINFAAGLLGDTELPGVKSIISRLMDQSDAIRPEDFVDGCLDLTGPLTVAEETRNELVAHVQSGGELRHGSESERQDFSQRTGEMLQFIATTSEFQFG